MSPRPFSPHSMSPSSTRVSSPAKSKPSDLPSPPPQSPTGEASGPTLSSPRTPSASQENVATQEKPMLQDQTNLLPFKQVVIVFAGTSLASPLRPWPSIPFSLTRLILIRSSP